MAQIWVTDCLRHHVLQARLWHRDLQLSWLKGLALRNLSGTLHVCLPYLIKLPQLEYLGVQTSRKPTFSSGAILAPYGDIPQAEEVNPSRSFMLAMSRIEGMPDTPANASSHAWYIKQQRQREVAAVWLERAFGPQDRHNPIKGVHRVLQYIPMREQHMSMEVVYCNAESRKLANQLLSTAVLCRASRSRPQVSGQANLGRSGSQISTDNQ